MKGPLLRSEILSNLCSVFSKIRQYLFRAFFLFSCFNCFLICEKFPYMENGSRCGNKFRCWTLSRTGSAVKQWTLVKLYITVVFQYKTKQVTGLTVEYNLSRGETLFNYEYGGTEKTSIMLHSPRSSINRVQGDFFIHLKFFPCGLICVTENMINCSLFFSFF